MGGALKIDWDNRPDMVKMLEEYYPDHTSKEVEEKMGLARETIRLRAKKMGLKKSTAFILRYPQAAAPRPANKAPRRKGVEHPAPGVTIHRLI